MKKEDIWYFLTIAVFCVIFFIEHSRLNNQNERIYNLENTVQEIRETTLGIEETAERRHSEEYHWVSTTEKGPDTVYHNTVYGFTIDFVSNDSFTIYGNKVYHVSIDSVLNGYICPNCFTWFHIDSGHGCWTK